VFDQLHIYQDGKLHSAALNMAIDEALFAYSKVPALRFYYWSCPTLSFGYFGKYDNAAKVGAGRELVRRWTGGGLVLHGSDLTYSLVIPFQNPVALPAREVYTKFHRTIRDTLIDIGICASLATSSSPKISEACFANPVFADVLVAGVKVAGAAQRRTRTGLLQQGSVQYPGLPNEFVTRLIGKLCPHAEARALNAKITSDAYQLAHQKYAAFEWLRRR